MSETLMNYDSYISSSHGTRLASSCRPRMQYPMRRNRGRGERTMTTLNWKNTVMWTAVSLLFLLLALMVGPAPALAKNQRADVILYEVTEDMYLKDDAGNIVNADPSKATRRTAVAQLSGWAALGTPLCPYDVLVVLPKAKLCAVNATGADDLSLVTGKGTLGGTFTVVVQGDNATDA